MKIEKENYKKLINNIVNEYINTPDEEKSLTRLQEKYGIKRKVIAENLKRRNIEIIKNVIPRLNENVFDSIDTEEKAYWLGFWYADGCVEANRHRLCINLGIKDINHLHKMRSFLELKNQVNTYKIGKYDMCRLYVTNQHIWQQLINLGCTPQKSLTLTFPNESVFSNKNLIYDFIRGYCDGDGSLGLYIKKGHKTSEISMVGTLEFLTGLQNFLGIDGHLRNKSYEGCHNNAYELKYSNFKARQVARLLYENSNVYLDRKYKIFESFCRFEEESSRVKSSKISRRWDANTEVISEITKGLETPQRVEGE